MYTYTVFVFHMLCVQMCVCVCIVVYVCTRVHKNNNFLRKYLFNKYKQLPWQVNVVYNNRKSSAGNKIIKNTYTLISPVINNKLVYM